MGHVRDNVQDVSRTLKFSLDIVPYHHWAILFSMSGFKESAGTITLYFKMNRHLRMMLQHGLFYLHIIMIVVLEEEVVEVVIKMNEKVVAETEVVVKSNEKVVAEADVFNEKVVAEVEVVNEKM